MKPLHFLALLLLHSAFCLRAPAQSTAFTYQGRLDDGGATANGVYDLRFALLDAASGPSQVGSTLTNAATAVTNGLFAVTLDFGSDVFTGAGRWLEIGVRTNGGGEFSLLTPRQPLTATPYAIQAANAASASGVSGTVSAAQITGTLSSNNIAAGSISTVMLATGAVGADQLASGAVTTSALADGAVTALKVAITNGSRWPLSTTFANPTPASGDRFGNSVAAVGSNRVLIGAPHDNTSGPGAGAAYLFSTNGTLLTTFPGPSDDNGYFGSSVAAVGSNRVLIGASSSSLIRPDAGAAFLLSTNFTVLTTFSKPTPASGDYFGKSVAAVGSDRVLIGAPADDTGTNNAGAAYLFSTSGTLLTTFTNPTPASGDYFGDSVAAVGSNRVLIGAYQDDTGATDAGAAYLFSTNGTLLATFTNPTPASDDQFGNSVAAVGSDCVLIGALGDNTGTNNAGAAYLFSTSGTLLTTFTNPSPDTVDQFGYSVAAVGSDRVLIGAYGDNTGAPSAGAAYLFRTNGTLLTTFTNPTPATDAWFGYSVAALGSGGVLIGAVGDDTGAAGAGAAYLFSLEPSFTPDLVAEGVRSGSIGTTSLENGAVTAAKIGGVLLPSQIPDLDASKITSGTLEDARLSTNVVLLHRSSQTFTGTNAFANTVIVTGPFYGSPPYLKFWEVQPKGTDGGPNVAGTNNFRNFTESVDTHALGSTNTSGDIVLPAGTYQCRISAPGYRVNSHQTRLRTTAGTLLLYGTTEYSDDALSPGVQSRSVIEGQFTLGATTTNQVQHYMQVVRSPNGLGVAGNSPWTDGNPVEVYSVAEFWKVQ